MITGIPPNLLCTVIFSHQASEASDVDHHDIGGDSTVASTVYIYDPETTSTVGDR